MLADADGDGLDWADEVFLYGTNPDDADSDHDGLSDAAEIAAGIDATKPDSDNDGINDGPDAYPDDRRRSEDIPTLHYIPLDFTEAIFGAGYVGWMASIDDDNRVGLLAAKYDVAFPYQIIEFKVASWVLGHPLSEAQSSIGTLPSPHRAGDFQAYYLPAGVNSMGTVVGTVTVGKYRNYPSSSTPPAPFPPVAGSFSFIWSGNNVWIDPEHYRKYAGVKNSGVAWGANGNGSPFIEGITFGKWIDEGPSDDGEKFHYDPGLFHSAPHPVPTTNGFPYQHVCEDGKAFGMNNYRSNPANHTSSYDLSSAALWNGVGFWFLFGGQDHETEILAVGNGPVLFGYSPHFTAPVDDDPDQAPGFHPFVIQGTQATEFKRMIPQKYKRQIAFGVAEVPQPLPQPQTWAVVNSNGALITKALFLEGPNKASGTWTGQGALLWDPQVPQKAWNADMGGLIPIMMNRDHLMISGASVLLPVEILDKDKKAVNKLKVGKMSETGVLSGTVASPTLDIEKDSDRFYVRIPGAASMAPSSIKVATVENPDASYNDDATEIDLQVEGNDLITKSMLLTSDDVDDAYHVDGIADNAKNDRTHKIQLGGKLFRTSHELDEIDTNLR